MSFIRIYALGSIVVALLKVAEGCLPLATNLDMDRLGLLKTSVEILWLVASVIALLVFPACKVSTLSPITYLLYNVGRLALRLGLTLGSVEADVPGWVHYVKVTNPHVLEYATIAFGIFFAIINTLLLLPPEGAKKTSGD